MPPPTGRAPSSSVVWRNQRSLGRGTRRSSRKREKAATATSPCGWSLLPSRPWHLPPHPDRIFDAIRVIPVLGQWYRASAACRITFGALVLLPVGCWIALRGRVFGSYMTMRAEYDLGCKSPSSFAGFGSL